MEKFYIFLLEKNIKDEYSKKTVDECNNLSHLTDLIFYIVKDGTVTMIFNRNFGEIKMFAVDKKVISIGI